MIASRGDLRKSVIDVKYWLHAFSLILCTVVLTMNNVGWYAPRTGLLERGRELCKPLSILSSGNKSSSLATDVGHNAGNDRTLLLLVEPLNPPIKSDVKCRTARKTCTCDLTTELFVHVESTKFVFVCIDNQSFMLWSPRLKPNASGDCIGKNLAIILASNAYICFGLTVVHILLPM